MFIVRGSRQVSGRNTTWVELSRWSEPYGCPVLYTWAAATQRSRVHSPVALRLTEPQALAAVET
eukprot:COSAG02_NODE_14109_length_1309_cov_1.677686_3_plen_63_part_01